MMTDIICILLGGGRALTSLADIALSPEMLKITMVVIVLDLSKVYLVLLRYAAARQE
jgi:hypothetical protein